MRFFIFFLEFYGAGLGLFFAMHVSSFFFSLQWRDFFKGLPVLLIWPLALFSGRGRQVLFWFIHKTQEL